MPTVNESLRLYLQAQLPRHNGRDLLERVLAHLPNMEIQVNVAAGDGEPVAGKRNTYTDGLNQWWNIRIPKNADTVPEWRDYPVTWPLDLHAEGIGATGWDYKAKRSRWEGFDVDSITGHAAGTGITDEELEKVKAAAEALPYVEVRKSTGGKGLHFYVHFAGDGIPTENHTEHAALARCVLGMMSSATGFDFASQVDVCGGNMWVWHRKSTKENDGLALVKAATQVLTAADLPTNWRDHIEVVTRRRAKIRLGAVPADQEDPFDTLASSRRSVPLDDSHKAVIEELIRSGFSTVWVPDYHLLQTHTKALQKLLDNPEKRASLKLKGYFTTLSEGRDPGTCNCFAFPLEGGAWKVYRFSVGTNETEMWEQDGNNWTTCEFNKLPDLKMASKAGGGLEAPNNGGYVFRTAKDAASVVEVLGQRVKIPDELENRETRLKTQKDGRLVISVVKNRDEIAPEGWLTEKKGFTRVLNIRSEMKAQENEDSYSEYDKIARFLVLDRTKSAGWSGRDDNGEWVDGTKDDMKGLLMRKDIPKATVDVAIANIWARNWKLANLPFQPEYPGDRRWNRNAAQYRFQPATLADGESTSHPHWDMILEHCFCDLDDVIKTLPWAQKANVKKGADYGLLWMACMLRNPFQHLPYLFFYGDEDCGKSIFHESFDYLMTKGRVSANNSLQNQNGFNGELEGAILAVIEEIDISHTPGALAKIKEWVTAPTIPIRKMRMDQFSMANTLHFIQVSNFAENCPILSGDTRITMIYVPPLEVIVPRDDMTVLLLQEAPHFMRTLLDVSLPKIGGRLGVPIIETHNKVRAQEQRRSPLEQFIAEQCHKVAGARIPYKDFYDKFLAWLPPDEHSEWSRVKVAASLPAEFPAGVHAENKKYVGNLSWEPEPPKDFSWIAVDGRLKVK